MTASLFSFSTVPVFSAESAYSRAVIAYEERDLERAMQQAQQAVREDPAHVNAQALLGELHYLKQELAQARACWEKALKLAPGRQDIRDRLEKLKKEQPVERDLDRSDTHPFVVRFASGQVPVDIGDLRRMLRDAHRKIGQSFGYFPNHTVTVLLYPEADFEKVKGLSHRVAGLYDGKIRLPLLSDRMTSRHLQTVLWHEYTHALVHDFSKGRCPIWLNEGIAQLQETRVNPVRLEAFRAARSAGKLPSWDSLWDQTEYNPATLELNYQTSYMIAQYLIKREGWSGLVRLLQRLGQGYPVRDALKAEYRMESPALEKEWLLWLRRTFS
ncbi:MAG: tetratricopeptide repeat protein [Candidatus Omnitrophica bacterium]|nr:tetratricopeptide repeat protein [Candidatus Omnitrophota bacterium]